VLSVVHTFESFHHREHWGSQRNATEYSGDSFCNFRISAFKENRRCSVLSDGDFWRGREQGFCVLMLRILRDLIGRVDLDNFAAVHHCDSR